MSKLDVQIKKVLKLSNAVTMELSASDFADVGIAVEKLESFIKTKGCVPIGPLIQYSNARIDENGELDVALKLIRQSSGFINHVEEPYKCEPVVRVKNCMYVRYTGPETMLKFAYDKINLTAFEEDIKLKGDSYTVFVNQVDDDIIADVFMERADEE